MLSDCVCDSEYKNIKKTRAINCYVKINKKKKNYSCVPSHYNQKKPKQTNDLEK